MTPGRVIPITLAGLGTHDQPPWSPCHRALGWEISDLVAMTINPGDYCRVVSGGTLKPKVNLITKLRSK